MIRLGFKTRLGFIAAAAGSAVGLGNIWKFPYEAGQHGGAAFLIIYLICIFVIGFPVMVAEIGIGRKTEKDPYGSFRMLGGASWGWAGLFGIICAIMILSFYNVVAGWALGYFVESVSGSLFSQEDMGQFFGNHVQNATLNIVYSGVFMLATAFVVSRGVQGGIEKFSKIMMPTLFILLLGLIGYSLTLKGAGEGLRFYLMPDFSKVNMTTISSAMGQAFFSLSLGLGALITYGSYLNKKEKITSSAAFVTITDTAVAFLAGLLIFPLVFSQGMEPTAGPGLVFVALPTIFQSMGGVTGFIVGSSFFLLLCFAALTSTISMLEIPVAYFVDELKWKRKKAVIVLMIGIYILSLPSLLSQGAVDFFSNFMHYEGKDQSFLDFVADLFSTVALPLGGTIICLFTAWKWGFANLVDEISISQPSFRNSILKGFLKIMIGIICPLILGLIFLSTVYTKYIKEFLET